MSKLEEFQAFIRSNGKELTGVDVPVVLSDEQVKLPQLHFTFGWTIEVAVTEHEHGGHCPTGIKSGSAANACSCANDTAKQYVNNENNLFNDRFIKILGLDIAKNFLIQDQSLQSAPETYVGSKVCYTCDGCGEETCSSCHGHGSRSCSSCNGSGSYAVTREEHNRTVHSRESCSTCGGSGSKTCYHCNGRGKITCRTCDGGGYLYFSYSIDGNAIRSTKWLYNSNDYHEWTTDYVKKTGLRLVNQLTDITEVAVDGPLNGCSFTYAFTAQLPTLQFTANIDNVATKLCFAGSNNRTHNAGGVYDPAVWNVAQNMAAGKQADDKLALATPAIKDIIEANETNTKIALLEENWVSSDIKDAVISNYQTLVAQLKKQSVKGIVPKMIGGLFGYAFLFLTLGILLSLLFPSFAVESQYRMSVLQIPEWMVALLTMKFGLFGLPAYVNYIFILATLWLSLKAVDKWYWKSIGRAKTWILAISLTLIVPHIGFTLYYNTIELATHHTPKLANTLVGGALFVGVYLLVLGAKLPNKWYTKLFGLLIGAAAYCGLQYGLFMANSTYELIEVKRNYPRSVSALISDAINFMQYNIAEWLILSVCFAYFLTRRQFWLKSKSAVTEYDSAVLLKSMNMDK